MNTIYCFTNLINNKKYIGSTIQEPSVRYNQHLYNATHENAHQYDYPLYRAIRKYGIENFSFEIVENVEDPQQLISREQYYIDRFNAVNEGYNICPIAGNTLGVYPSNESRQKMSEAHKGVGKGIPKSEEHKKKISKSVSNSIKGENNPFYGKHHSEETKKKIKDKVSGEKHHAYGKHLSEEHKRKISLANKGKHSKPRKQ